MQARLPAKAYPRTILPMRPGHSALRVLTNLVWPRGCLGCDQPAGPDDGPWCARCAQALLATTAQPYCPRCGLTAGTFVVSPAGCSHCESHPLPVDGLCRVGPYQGFLRDLLRRYKFGREQRLDRALAEMLVSALQSQSWSDDLEILVPVPATWKSRLQYGFRPVDQLSQEAGHQLGLPSFRVVRTRGKRRRQVGLDQRERVRNVRGVFQVAPKARLGGVGVCIVDDITTTGSTLREMARVLRDAGADPVFAAVVAKTPPSEADLLDA